MTWLLDLDGVVWLSDDPVAGSVSAIASLRERGERVVFITNNSSATAGEYLAKLERYGIDASIDDLFTSAQAAAGLLEPGDTALVCAGAGVEEALQAGKVTTVRTGDADAVVVGWHREFDFVRLSAAFDAVHHGARLIGTNDDATYPTPDGPIPGGGSLLAAVAYASGATPTVAGKPYEPMAELLRARVEDPLIMVGDRPSTDGMFAQRLGIPFALVLSGVTPAEAPPTEPAPAYVVADLATLVDQYGGELT